MTAPRLRGSMTAAAPRSATPRLLVLLPSLGTTTELWDGVVARLASAPDSPRILRVDLPGHGASPSAREAFSVADLATSVLALVDEIGGGAFDVAGDSLGGAVALELALAAPERVRSLAMFCSGAAIGTPEGWAERAAQVRASGTASVVAGSAQRWFAPGYLDAHPDGPGGHALKTLIDIDDESYALCCEALAAFDRRDAVAAVRAPALIVAGAHDQVTTSALMAELAAGLPNARFVELAHAAHLVPLEDPAETAALLTALHASGDDASPHARGMAVRRAVLGDAHVDRATAAITEETADFQDFITRYAWGEVWSRPQLSRQQRSIATLASLVTGGHEGELRMHVRAALRNGLTRTEIAEVIHHTAIYAGLPAANSALAIMREVFAEQNDETEGTNG
ncbi:bifunctional 3-oxoadipate enol-lactonase/4-carboxymuconolactone decarboxylase PcaDC [Leifsonia sp. Leaf336]|uniref:bifunctional 3-oxoadipate enol-lactonase/4-carboxymuconolactone decarboxylase PcaDC n=1 Tax=Leifsonia sp. Leaf336 TaxID=1736341 RepID=UPI000B10E93B|nr:4-carboxymuconolactone decarboxylase [Leifsonia sp. Leaf336]